MASSVVADDSVLTTHIQMCVMQKNSRYDTARRCFFSADIAWFVNASLVIFEGLPFECLADRAGCLDEPCTFWPASVCVRMPWTPVIETFSEECNSHIQHSWRVQACVLSTPRTSAPRFSTAARSRLQHIDEPLVRYEVCELRWELRYAFESTCSLQRSYLPQLYLSATTFSSLATHLAELSGPVDTSQSHNSRSGNFSSVRIIARSRLTCCLDAVACASERCRRDLDVP